MSLAPCRRETLRRSNVIRLAAFAASAKQHNNGGTALLVINAIARAVMNTQFANSFSNWSGVARMPVRQSVQPREDDTNRALIAKSAPSFPERRSLLQFDHVVLGLQDVK
jgi:hypothetical protein